MLEELLWEMKNMMMEVMLYYKKRSAKNNIKVISH